MQVNKERAQRVIDYVNKTARVWADTKSGTDRYTFSRFVKEHGIGEGQKERGHEVLISCPFHEDESPSCSLNEQRRMYHCFSCDRGGSYLDFAIECERTLYGSTVSFYAYLNRLLREDAVMRTTLGFNTLYEEETVSLDFKRFRPRLIFSPVPTTYLELADAMQRMALTENEIVFGILLMQKGSSPEEIYYALKKPETEHTGGELYGLWDISCQEHE